jgi:hypothetical protein
MILFLFFAAKSQPQLVERRLTRRGTRRGSSGQKAALLFRLGFATLPFLSGMKK